MKWKLNILSGTFSSMTISITSTPTIWSRSIDISPKSVIEDLVGSNLELGDLDEEKEKKPVITNNIIMIIIEVVVEVIMEIQNNVVTEMIKYKMEDSIWSNLCECDSQAKVILMWMWLRIWLILMSIFSRIWRWSHCHCWSTWSSFIIYKDMKKLIT